MDSDMLARFSIALLLMAPACSIDSSGPLQPTPLATAVALQLDDVYASCPYEAAELATRTCSTYHPGSTITGYCFLDTCFEMSYGDELRFVAADELGPFPGTWFAWHNGSITPAAGFIPCGLTTSGRKTRLEIPTPGTRCAVAFSTAEHLYFEHIASNPTSGCLGWVECKKY